MHYLLILIFIFSTLSAVAQKTQLKIFSKTAYVNGAIFRQSKDTIKTVNEPLDIYFYKRHFFTPYYLPASFTDLRYKNKTISVWNDPGGKKDYMQNWENTYTYDSLGRVISYTYTGCIICSNMPYSYTVTYNQAGQVIRLVNTGTMKDGYWLYYNGNAEIYRVEKYVADKPELDIRLNE